MPNRAFSFFLKINSRLAIFAAKYATKHQEL